MDILGLATMTSAAKCDKGCELQKFVSHHFLERNWHQDVESWYEWRREGLYITSLLRWIMKVFWFRLKLLLNWWMFGTWRVYPWSCLTDKSLFCVRWKHLTLLIPPPFIQDYPPNLSISISGGKETNWDSLSNGEWRGSSPTSKGKPVVGYESMYGKDFLSGICWKTVPLRVIAP